MEYKKAKTKLDRIKEQGLPIRLVKVYCLMSRGVIIKVEAIYKEIMSDPNKDLFFMKRIKRILKITDKKTNFTIKKVEIIKHIGYGIYES